MLILLFNQKNTFLMIKTLIATQQEKIKTKGFLNLFLADALIMHINGEYLALT